MSKALAVAARELRERWLLFPAGLALGFVTLALPAFGIPSDKAPAVGLLIAILLGAVAALVIGSSMLARDAADGRLDFLFSRPVPWPAIWGGKWLAALVLVAGSGTFAFVPWMLTRPPDTHGGSWGAALLDPQGSAFFLVLLLLGVGLANFNATAFRSRSAWVALDLGLLLLALWAVRQWVAPLYYLRIVWPYLSGSWGFLFPIGPAALALVVASAAQVAFGRTDLRRAHRAMSLAFWLVVFASLAGAGLRLAWARGARPSDVTVNAASHDPSGRWLYVFGGSRRGGAARFLIDTEDGRYLPMSLERRWEGVSRGMAFSGDGRFGATLVPGPGTCVLDLADLSGGEPRFARVELEDSPPPSFGTGLALSTSGSTALLTHGHGASLFALPSGRRVATATIPPGWRTATTRLLGETGARIWLIPSIGVRPRSSEAEMRILEFGAGRQTRATEVPLEAPLDPVRGWPHHANPDDEGRRFLSRDGGVRLRDGATGALLATLVETETPVSATFLADGRIVVGEAIGAQIKVCVFSTEGAPLREAIVDRIPAMLEVGPEVTPGRVAIHFNSSTRAGGAPITGYFAGVFFGDTVVFDVTEGRVVETLEAMRPVPDFWRLEPPARPARAAASTVHFFARGGDLVRVDFATGERRVVAGPGAPAGERLKAP